MIHDFIFGFFLLKVDCEWSEWSIGECSVSCGGGTRIDTRDKVVEEEILERNIKVRAQEIISDRKLAKDYSHIKSGTKITSEDLDKISDYIIDVPTTHPKVFPLLASISLQLLAYHLAVLRGCDIDQPRNLAKSVTVE